MRRTSLVRLHLFHPYTDNFIVKFTDKFSEKNRAKPCR
jgi:hypothetical protein